MNTIYRLTTLFALMLTALGADVKFSSLPTATSPSTNSYLPIIDLNLLPAAQNEKYLLTNLARATPAGITNALGYVPVNKAGDDMTSLSVSTLQLPFASSLVGVNASSNAVAATSTMVTNALGYVPVNKAGDTNGSALFEFGSLQLNTQLTLSNDVKLVRDAANAMALRNGTNAQTFIAYETYTDASNYRGIRIAANIAGVAYIEPILAGTGTGSGKDLNIRSSTSASLGLGGGGGIQWYINNPGHLIAASDNTYNIGADAANRPATVNAATKFKGPQYVISGTTNQVVFGSTNTAPVSALAPTKWISVQVSGESTVYRLPLYE